MGTLKHIAELALIRSIPDCCSNIRPGKERGLYDRLQKAVDKDLSKYKIYSKDLDLIEPKIEAFGKLSGWQGQEKHPVTMLGFCLVLIEKSDRKFNNKIIETINKIVAHYERGNMLKSASCWAAILAAEKWEALFEN